MAGCCACWAGDRWGDAFEGHGEEGGVGLEEEGREGRAEEGPYEVINHRQISSSRPPLTQNGRAELTVDPTILRAHRSVNILTIRAKQLDRINPGRIDPTAGDDGLALTVDSRTDPKGGLFEPFGLTRESSLISNDRRRERGDGHTIACNPAFVRMNR